MSQAGLITLGSPISASNANSQIVMVDDFVSNHLTGGQYGIYQWFDQQTNSTDVNSTAGHPGIITLITDPGNGDLNQLQMGYNDGPPLDNSFILGGGVLTMQMLIQIPTLSVVGQRFTISFGIGTGDGISVVSTQPDGLYFTYSDNVNSGKWVINASASSVSTTANTNSTVDTSWHMYKIIVNAAGTSASFYIDGVQVANSPIATNIPTVNPITPYLNVIKSVGASNSSVQIDLFTLTYNLTTPR